MSSNTILAEQVREVAQLRAEKEQLAARIKDAREAFEATILDQTTRLKTVSEALSMAEAHAKAEHQAAIAGGTRAKICAGRPSGKASICSRICRDVSSPTPG